MGLMDLFKKKSLGFKSKRVPFHFEIHDDSFLLEVESDLDRKQVFELFFKCVKRLRKKTDLKEVDELPVSFSADIVQLKALESLVVNKSFLEDVSKQVRKDVPTFKIITSGLAELSWIRINPDKYRQKIVIKGICYYEELK